MSSYEPHMFTARPQVTKDRGRAFGDSDAVGMGPTCPEVVVASSCTLPDGALSTAAPTPFSAPAGGEAALEARARAQAARRTRERHRHVGRETWQKYADLGSADVDARGRRIAESVWEESLSTGDGVVAQIAEADENLDLWKRRQTSSALFQRRGGVYYRDTPETAAEVDSSSSPAPPDADGHAQHDDDDCETEVVVETRDGSAGLDGLYALAPESAYEGTVTQGLRSLLDDITQMQLQNVIAAERQCSSAAPRMRLTPRQQRQREKAGLQSIRSQPRDAPAGVWNEEAVYRGRQPTEELSSTDRAEGQGETESAGDSETHAHTPRERDRQQDEQGQSRRLIHRLRSAQRVRTPREKQLLARRAAADLAARICR